MNYTASVFDFFKSPKWMMNILLGGVCVLIPVVGPLVLLGWLITGFWGRQEDNYEAFPPFEFSHFGKYLERGLCPFLVSLVVGVGASVVLVPLGWVLMLPVMLISNAGGEEGSAAGCLGGVATILILMFWVLAMFSMMLVLVPLMLRASLTQDFAKSFDVGFVKRFLALTWKEIVFSTLFLVVAGTALTLVGMLVFCIGMYFAVVVVYFSWAHLHKQLYRLYLSRGGEPVALSPKLFDTPPPLAPA